MEPEKDIFISYTQTDKEIAEKIAIFLEKQKIGNREIKVFYAPWDIKPGHNLINKINEGLTEAKFFALILSPDALNAPWPKAEAAAALHYDPSGYLGRVIPILVKDCQVPPLLRIRVWIDVRDKTKFKSEMERLTSMIKGEELPRGQKLRDEVSTESDLPSLHTRSSTEPDEVDEKIHTNLYPVQKFPQIIYSAPTTFSTKRDVLKNIPDLPRFILKDQQIFTFSNLNDVKNKLRCIISFKNTESISVQEWFKDKDKSRYLIELLNIEIKGFCHNLGLNFDKKGKQYYGDKNKIIREKISWTPHVKKGHRYLIIPNKKIDKVTNQETIRFYRHRAVNFRFFILENKLFLSINISSKPLSFTTRYGIYGDHKDIPDIHEKPPQLKQPSSFMPNDDNDGIFEQDMEEGEFSDF